jgi:hypothetical protein
MLPADSPYRGVISLVGHLAHDTTGMNLLDFTTAAQRWARSEAAAGAT